MDEQETPAVSRDRSTGRVIMGALLVTAGIALMIERLGAMPAAWRDSIWPLLLIGYGMARLLQPREGGREGLFFVLAGAWWLGGVAGWLSFERTWPLLFVALGISIMLQSATTGPAADPLSPRLHGRRRGAAPWLLLAILLGAGVSSGLGRQDNVVQEGSQEGRLRVFSVMGGSSSHMRMTTLKGGQVVAIMGGNAIDLRDVTIEPGQTVTLDVFTLLGGGSIRVPESWSVDFQVAQVLGGVKDQRNLFDDGWRDGTSEPPVPAAANGPAPHLIIRGSVILGGLVVKS